MTTLHPNQPVMGNVGMNHPMSMANYHAEGFSSPFAATGAMTPTAGFLLESMSMSSLDGGMGLQRPSPEAGFAAGPNTDSGLAARRMRMMENRYASNELHRTQPSDLPFLSLISVNDAFEAFSASSAQPLHAEHDLQSTASPEPWQSPMNAGQATSQADVPTSSLSPEDGTNSSSAESDLSNPLENATAALLNSLGVDSNPGGYYDGTDLSFNANFSDPSSFAFSPASMPPMPADASSFSSANPMVSNFASSGLSPGPEDGPPPPAQRQQR